MSKRGMLTPEYIKNTLDKYVAKHGDADVFKVCDKFNCIIYGGYLRDVYDGQIAEGLDIAVPSSKLKEFEIDMLQAGYTKCFEWRYERAGSTMVRVDICAYYNDDFPSPAFDVDALCYKEGGISRYLSDDIGTEYDIIKNIIRRTAVCLNDKTIDAAPEYDEIMLMLKRNFTIRLVGVNV